MTVIYSQNDIIVLNHKEYLDKTYKVIADENISLICNSGFFAIHSPFKLNNKRKHRDDNFCEIAKYIQKAFSNAFDHLRTVKIGTRDDEHISAKDCADTFYKQSAKRSFDNFHGGNANSYNIIIKFNEEEYIIPRECKFYNYNVARIEEFLKQEQYDFILLDPPWWNKFIRRKKAVSIDISYEMLWNTDLIKLPIAKLLGESGLIAVWCTNSPAHLSVLQSEIFPAWNVEYAATWYWVKVTTTGEPVTPFSPLNGKQPFERLIFAARKPGLRSRPTPEDGKLLVSVPSSIHSHKPPLCEALQPYVPENPKCLEVFARYLLPRWTSFGNEVLKLQHISFFTKELPEMEEKIFSTVALEQL